MYLSLNVFRSSFVIFLARNLWKKMNLQTLLVRRIKRRIENEIIFTSYCFGGIHLL